MFSLLSLFILLLLDVPNLQFSDFEISDNSCEVGECVLF
jgi:competence protein ComGC